MLRRLVLLVVVLLTACTNANDLDRAGVSLGDFALGYNVAVAPKMVKGPASRDATEAEWQAALTAAVDERFRRYDETGSKLYHIAISVEGYVLAAPGIPLVLSPKSALIFNVTIWDDAAQKKLNEKPHQITVLESASGETLLGSGLTQTKQQQLRNLSRNAAKEIQTWMQQQMRAEGWFGGLDAVGLAGPSSPAALAVAAGTAPALPEATAPATAPVVAPNPAPAASAPPAPPAAQPRPQPALILPDETILEPAVVPPPLIPPSDPATQG